GAAEGGVGELIQGAFFRPVPAARDPARGGSTAGGAGPGCRDPILGAFLGAAPAAGAAVALALRALAAGAAAASRLGGPALRRVGAAGRCGGGIAAGTGGFVGHSSVLVEGGVLALHPGRRGPPAVLTPRSRISGAGDFGCAP